MNDVFIQKLPFVNPETLFRLLREKKHFIWLDSSLRGRGGEYSIMAYEPFLIFRSKGEKTDIFQSGGGKTFSGACPMDILDNLLQRYKCRSPHFFSPGALGYFSYDLGRRFETIPDISVDDLNMPDIWLGFYDTLLLIGHKDESLHLVSANLQGLDEKTFRFMLGEKTGMLKKAASGKDESEKGNERLSHKPAQVHEIFSNITYRQYVKAIDRIKGYIASGDVYQINLARRIEAKGVFSPEEIYLKLRTVNPTSFSGYLDTGDFQLLSNSPEIFIRKEGRKVVTKPMKGTRPRGDSRKQDMLYRDELLASEKDKAELVMIVDLERNDIGRICRHGTVKVRKLRQVERYNTVFQTTALVEGTLKEEVTTGGLLKATFPGGSITGAPKIRAMEIIEELEPNKRGFYTGSMGYLGFNGNIELNILIRTLMLKGNRLYYPVGGGIVWDSTPEGEYEETEAKAKSLFLTLGCGDEKGILPS